MFKKTESFYQQLKKKTIKSKIVISRICVQNFSEFMQA